MQSKISSKNAVGILIEYIISTFNKKKIGLTAIWCSKKKQYQRLY